MSAPQSEIFAVVDHAGELITGSASNRWAFKSLHAARTRVLRDFHNNPQAVRKSRVARYKFDGWIE